MHAQGTMRYADAIEPDSDRYVEDDALPRRRLRQGSFAAPSSIGTRSISSHRTRSHRAGFRPVTSQYSPHGSARRPGRW
jgi:hypothetical protein